MQATGNDTPRHRLLSGKSGVNTITRFDASDYPTNFAAQIKDFDNEGYVRTHVRARSTLIHLAA